MVTEMEKASLSKFRAATEKITWAITFLAERLL